MNGSVYSSSPICSSACISIRSRIIIDHGRRATYLGRKIEPQIRASRNVVLDQKGHLIRQADLDRARQRARLAKVDEVLERERQAHGLAQLNLDILGGFINIGVLAESNAAVADIALAAELDAVLGRLDVDALAHGHQVGRDALELGARHRDGRSVLGVGDAQVLLVNVHQLEVVLGDAVVFGALKDEVEHVGRVLGLERQDVLVLRGAEDLGQRSQVDAERNVAVAPEGREGLRLEHHGYERDVRVVHGLEGDSRVIAVEVAVLHEVLDGVDDLDFTSHHGKS